MKLPTTMFIALASSVRTQFVQNNPFGNDPFHPSSYSGLEDLIAEKVFEKMEALDLGSGFGDVSYGDGFGYGSAFDPGYDPRWGEAQAQEYMHGYGYLPYGYSQPQAQPAGYNQPLQGQPQGFPHLSQEYFDDSYGTAPSQQTQLQDNFQPLEESYQRAQPQGDPQLEAQPRAPPQTQAQPPEYGQHQQAQLAGYPQPLPAQPQGNPEPPQEHFRQQAQAQGDSQPRARPEEYPSSAAYQQAQPQYDFQLIAQRYGHVPYEPSRPQAQPQREYFHGYSYGRAPHQITQSQGDSQPRGQREEYPSSAAYQQAQPQYDPKLIAQRYGHVPYEHFQQQAQPQPPPQREYFHGYGYGDAQRQQTQSQGDSQPRGQTEHTYGNGYAPHQQAQPQGDPQLKAQPQQSSGSPQLEAQPQESFASGYAGRASGFGHQRRFGQNGGKNSRGEGGR